MVSIEDVVALLTKLTPYEWAENEDGLYAYMDNRPFGDGALELMIENIKTKYPFLKQDLTVTMLTDTGRIISSTANKPEMAGVKVEHLSRKSKSIRVTISNVIVKKFKHALSLTKKVATHLINLTGTQWRMDAGGLILSDSWLNDISEFEKAVKIIKEHYPGHFSEVTGKWDRSVSISMKGIEAISKLMK